MNKTNFFLDTAIFGGFLAALTPELTGLPIHEWLSLALAGTLIVHLLLHWNWITAVLKTFFRKLFHLSRLKFAVDFLLLISMVTVMVSGLMVSRVVLPVLGLTVTENPVWEVLHSLSAELVLWLAALHVALNWKWVVSAFKRYILIPLRSVRLRAFGTQAQPVVVKAETPHRR
ncbi:MAG: DUF4405 domain-containing protein [Chloroflexota bacterium]|nr:MAG: hypothetical protein KatS3mg045_1191 [Bellilinea sp.]